MKIKIIKSQVVMSDDKDDKDIIFVDLVWQEIIGVINKRRFAYYELCRNKILFDAFKKHHPEFFL